MKKDSKSGLKMQQILVVVFTLMILSTNIQLFALNNQKEEIVQNTTIEQTQLITEERKINNTTRAMSERTIEESKEKYIEIEEIKISKNMDLTKRCGISKEDFKILMTNLKPDTTGFFENNSDIIYDLCKKYEINEIFFCGLIAAESGWEIASSHRKANNYVSMMSRGRLIRYNTPEEGLEAATKLLHNSYLTEGGSYYYGKTLSAVQTKYCPNSSTWVNLVFGCMNVII